MYSSAITGEIDPNAFFHDEVFERDFPGVRMPPPCFLAAGGRLLAHEPRKSLTIAFPARQDQTNPVGALQGGVLASFFDNTFGPLSFATVRKPCVSIDLNVNFVRSVPSGATVVIHAEIKSRSRTTIHLFAEARNEKQKLIATATTNMMIHEIRGHGAGDV